MEKKKEREGIGLAFQKMSQEEINKHEREVRERLNQQCRSNI